MGINVHKVIGYGLTDVKMRKRRGGYSHVLTDKRFDPSGYMYADWETKEEHWTVEGYRRFLKQWKKGRCITASADLDSFTFAALARKKPKPYYKRFLDWDPCYSVIHQLEFGLPNVLVIVPFAFYPKWYRSDDTLDWCEETQEHEQQNRVLELPRGIYPYSDRYWDPRRKKLHIFGCEKPGERSLLWHDIQRRLSNGTLRPAVPSEIQCLAEYLGIFKNPDDIHRLRPLLYVYWA
jgi:hypothetical protein